MPSKIEWTDETWNPTVGCSKVSDGCKNCYAIREAHRLAGNPNPKISAAYKGLTVIQNGALNWTGKVRFVEDRLPQPLHWKTPRRVFVDSMSDLFHPELRFMDILRVFEVMADARCKDHRFQILTKQPEVAEAFLEWLRHIVFRTENPLDIRMQAGEWPLSNVYLGFSAEDQATFDQRWKVMRELGFLGWKIFVSLEPLRGSIQFDAALASGLTWVITGGESGPGARPPHPQWFREIRDQCNAAGVPFFFKQWGNFAFWEPKYPVENVIHVAYDGAHGDATGSAGWVRRGGRIEADSSTEPMAPVGKKTAGRILDGRTWDEFPEVHRV